MGDPVRPHIGSLDVFFVYLSPYSSRAILPVLLLLEDLVNRSNHILTLNGEGLSRIRPPVRSNEILRSYGNNQILVGGALRGRVPGVVGLGKILSGLSHPLPIL